MTAGREEESPTTHEGDDEMTKVAKFAVFKSTTLVGTVKAVNYEQAVARAHGRYGICDVELAYERAPLRKERLQANQQQQGKQARRYPTTRFEERRAALIASYQDEED